MFSALRSFVNYFDNGIISTKWYPFDKSVKSEARRHINIILFLLPRVKHRPPNRKENASTRLHGELRVTRQLRTIVRGSSDGRAGFVCDTYSAHALSRPNLRQPQNAREICIKSLPGFSEHWLSFVRTGPWEAGTWLLLTC